MSIAFTNKSFGRIRADWPCVLLPTVAFFQEGPGLRKWQWTDSGMKVINGTNVLTSGEFDVNNTNRFISLNEFHATYSHFAVEPSDIVVVSSGSIGKVSRVRSEHLPLMMNTSVIRFHSADTDQLDDDYLFAYLRSPLFQNQATAFAIGSAQLNFGPVHIKQMELPLPPLTTQRKIAAILSAYDDRIENNNLRIKLLEEMVQRIYREWFVEFRYPGHDENDPLVDSELGPIPQGWVIKSVGECVAQSTASINPGLFSDELFEHFSIPSFDEGRRARLEPGSTIKSNKFVVDGRCVLYSKLNPRIPRVWMATPGANTRAVASTELLVLTPRPGWNLAIMYCFLCSDVFADRIVGMAGGTSTSHQRVRPHDLLGVRIADSGSELCQLFDQAVGDVLALTDELRRSTWVLQETRDLLLPRLTSGEVDVADLDIAMVEDAA